MVQWIWYSNAQYGKGPNNSVKIVQRTLNSQVSTKLLVDGVFGPATKSAYAKWQRHLGYSGTGADGIPGKSSMKALAKAGKFTVVWPGGNPPKKEEKKTVSSKPWIWFQNVVPTPKNGTNSVKIVQRALNTEVSAGLAVDGEFGPRTKAGYAKWQRHLGYTGSAADGTPGKTSLTKLSVAAGFDIKYPAPAPKATNSNYETMPEPSQDHTRVYWGGRIVNKRTAVLLDRAEEIYGRSFSLTQGSYNTGVAASAGTHDGGGVVDVNVNGQDMYKLQLALRKAGFAAWVRTPAQGFSYHIHAVDIGNNDTAWLARSQVQSYFDGRDGLAGNHADNTEHRWPNWADKYNK